MARYIETLRWIVFVINLIFWLMGIIIFAIGLWLRFDTISGYTDLEPEGLGDYYTIAYLLISAGVVMTVLGFLGCCGALKKSQLLLVLFFILLLFVVACEFAVGILAWMYKDKVRGYVEKGLNQAIKTKYGPSNPKFSSTIDSMQKSLECCGVRSPYDWLDSAWTTQIEGDRLPELGLGSYDRGRIPQSCCNAEGIDRFGEEGCGLSFDQLPLKNYTDYVYNRGCMDAVAGGFYHRLDVATGIAITFCALQLIGIVLTMLLCCWLNKLEYESMKNEYDE